MGKGVCMVLTGVRHVSHTEGWTFVRPLAALSAVAPVKEDVFIGEGTGSIILVTHPTCSRWD